MANGHWTVIDIINNPVFFYSLALALLSKVIRGLESPEIQYIRLQCRVYRADVFYFVDDSKAVLNWMNVDWDRSNVIGNT